MKRLVLVAAFAAVALLSTHVLAGDAKPAAAEPKNKVVEQKATKATRGAADPNIKTARPANDPKAVAPAGNRGGALCQVHIDSRSNWFVDIYIDGSGRGTVGPYGDGYTIAVAGGTVGYAVAPFPDGERSTWGPTQFYCPPGGTFTWVLNGN